MPWLDGTADTVEVGVVFVTDRRLLDGEALNDALNIFHINNIKDKMHIKICVFNSLLRKHLPIPAGGPPIGFAIAREARARENFILSFLRIYSENLSLYEITIRIK